MTAGRFLIESKQTPTSQETDPTTIRAKAMTDDSSGGATIFSSYGR